MLYRTFFIATLLSTSFMYGGFSLSDMFNNIVDKVKEKIGSKPSSKVKPTEEEEEKMDELVDKTMEAIKEEKKVSKKELYLKTCIELLPCLTSEEFTEGEKAALHKLISKLMKKTQ